MLNRWRSNEDLRAKLARVKTSNVIKSRTSSEQSWFNRPRKRKSMIKAIYRMAFSNNHKSPTSIGYPAEGRSWRLDCFTNGDLDCRHKITPCIKPIDSIEWAIWSLFLEVFWEVALYLLKLNGETRRIGDSSLSFIALRGFFKWELSFFLLVR